MRESDYVALGNDDFMATFESLWGEHVDFGTSRSHKKLIGKTRQPEEWRLRLDAKKAKADAGERASEHRLSVPGRDAKRKKKAHAPGAGSQDLATGAVETAEPAAPRAPAVAPAPAPLAPTRVVMPNKGRFGGTLAAQLLAGR